MHIKSEWEHSPKQNRNRGPKKRYTLFTRNLRPWISSLFMLFFFFLGVEQDEQDTIQPGHVSKNRLVLRLPKLPPRNLREVGHGNALITSPIGFRFVMGVYGGTPILLMHFRLVFSMKYTIHNLGYPHPRLIVGNPRLLSVGTVQ